MTPAKRPGRAPSAPKTALPAIETIPLRDGSPPHPAIGLGLWALGRWSAEDEARTKATIARGYELGVRWFDTAEVYGAGRSERLLGEVLHRSTTGAAEGFVVSKVSWEHLRPAQVRASLVNTLERLGRRSVDLYLVHAPDPKVPLSETMGALERLWKEHRVGAIGVSNFSVEEMEEAQQHLAEAKIVVNQVRYNLLDPDDGEAVREYCQRAGILIEAYTPLARGLLNGRYLDGQRIPASVRRLSERILEPDREEATLARARALRDLATQSKVPLESIALHWLRRQGAAPVFGASRPEQVDANLAAWAARPTERVLARAEKLARGEDA